MTGVSIDVAISRSQRSCKIKNTFGTTGSTMVDLLGDSESNFQGFLWTKFSSLLFICLFFELFSYRCCCCYFLDLFFYRELVEEIYIFYGELCNCFFFKFFLFSVCREWLSQNMRRWKPNFTNALLKYLKNQC